MGTQGGIIWFPRTRYARCLKLSLRHLRVLHTG
nr:MAG TPA: hypothetical protein [Caudoviricetes sp.]